MYHGWADGGLTPLRTISYYEQVQARDAKVRDYARLFMVPGVLHCVGGPGPDTIDWPSVIADWVENGKAPERVIAQKLSAGTIKQSRPLCPYPQHAVYKGKGSTDEADNFICR
jgi:feruloyl esterase